VIVNGRGRGVRREPDRATAPIGGGAITERGGQYIGPTQDRLRALAEAYDVATFPTYTTGTGPVTVDGRPLNFELHDTLWRMPRPSWPTTSTGSPR
jgi:monoamine oxidase